MNYFLIVYLASMLICGVWTVVLLRRQLKLDSAAAACDDSHRDPLIYANLIVAFACTAMPIFNTLVVLYFCWDTSRKSRSRVAKRDAQPVVELPATQDRKITFETKCSGIRQSVYKLHSGCFSCIRHDPLSKEAPIGRIDGGDCHYRVTYARPTSD